MTNEELRKLKTILEFIACGDTIPEAKEARDDERIELALHVIRSAQIKAKEGLALLDADSPDTVLA
jgi:hypothetical protein